MTSLAPVNSDSLAPLSKEAREFAVTQYLTDARDRLAVALEVTGPQAVAAIKAEIATAAEATKQLGLSKEIRDDATEMVRRAEYALGKAIRMGQEEGAVRTRADGAAVRDQVCDPYKVSVGDFFKHKNEMTEVYASSDGVTPEQHEEALSEARAEGNLSRANVVRKVKRITCPQSRDQRADLIADLAEQGNTSAQMARRVGVTEEVVRRIARDYGVEIPADRVTARTRRIDSLRIVRETVSSLDGMVTGIGLVGVDALREADPREVQQWAASLDQSISALRSLNKKIKEAASNG